MKKLEKLSLLDIAVILGMEVEDLLETKLSILYELVEKQWALNAASMELIMLKQKYFS